MNRREFVAWMLVVALISALTVGHVSRLCTSPVRYRTDCHFDHESQIAPVFSPKASVSQQYNPRLNEIKE